MMTTTISDMETAYTDAAGRAISDVDAETTSHLEGLFLVKTHAAFKTGSSLNGRILAQTACTLDTATITKPST